MDLQRFQKSRKEVVMMADLMILLLFVVLVKGIILMWD
jgi:hypothetical protein